MYQKNTLDLLQSREVFHLEFLRRLGRVVKAGQYALKGGANLRFFFQSLRYSEDMDLDVGGIRVDVLRDAVMGILEARSFRETLSPFGIEKITPPNISKAKQTETTQRFKLHLIVSSGQDLFTKIDFSRRGLKEKIIVQSVSDMILRDYKMPPLLVPHYAIDAAIAQKIGALAMRSVLQARDIFDLYVLSSQASENELSLRLVGSALLAKAHDRVFKISFEQFRDTVISYLAPEDQRVYAAPDSWDEVKLKVSCFIEGLEKRRV
jgi:predicted nucleotidyltransferase component of viral defense system